jgi:hypothetical protein
MDLSITGLDYDKLSANSTLMAHVSTSVVSSTLASLPSGYTQNHVAVAFSKGASGRRLVAHITNSVVANVQITPMSEDSFDTLKQTVTNNKNTISTSTTTSVKTIAGVDTVLDDNAVLNDLTTVASEPVTVTVTTPAPSPVETSSANGFSAAAVLLLGAVAAFTQ